MSIDSFSGEYAFLSNSYVDGLTPGPTVEHRFHASKTLDADARTRILAADTPHMALAISRHYETRADWESIEVDVMLVLLLEKFKSPELRERLLATGTENLRNFTVADRKWGIDLRTGRGKNLLGLLLHVVRAEIMEGA